MMNVRALVWGDPTVIRASRFESRASLSTIISARSSNPKLLQVGGDGVGGIGPGGALAWAALAWAALGWGA